MPQTPRPTNDEPRLPACPVDGQTGETVPDCSTSPARRLGFVAGELRGIWRGIWRGHRARKRNRKE
ncbi:MAG: hypothetical protein BGP03_27015 [Pseudonocardia sp. 73-21]|nr:MAG: hypothetical protein BGP03_27015 [Pseudonocardia sp. 73-21]